CAVARVARQPTHGARGGQPLVGRAFRAWPGHDPGGLRHARRAAVASGTPRLARGRAHGSRLVDETRYSHDRHLIDVSPIITADTRVERARRRESAVCSRAAPA